MTCSPPRTRINGYTLVELLVVVGVLAIAGTLLLPNLIDKGTFAIQAAARSIVSDIVFAQSDALANQEYRRFQFINGTAGSDGFTGYCILRVDPSNMNWPYDESNADYIEDSMQVARNQGNFIVDFGSDDRFRGVVIESVNLDAGLDYMTFDEYGGSVSSAGGVPGIGGVIDLTSGSKRYRVNVAPFTAKTTVEVIELP
ncbi:MAG: hypothetical protein CBC35_06485 [Planctomycetes bacterium TMED75]|nr:hypothetical protein [Planctomycetaceae bacterium]OUU92949.1 MAG: hypothetical protein CBC35_06485 [Planctomycetes bacterium TMED75]